MSVDFDLATLRTFVNEFEAFLKSEVVFWPTGGRSVLGPQPPSLTVGGLLLLRRTLAARRPELAPEQFAELLQLEARAESLFARWPANIEQKALREVGSRLNVWAAAIEECGESPRACAENYAGSVLNRVHLALLVPLVARLPEADSSRRRLEGLDATLRGLITPDDFIWNAALQAAFPRPEFWFLYGRPRAQA